MAVLNNKFLDFTNNGNNLIGNSTTGCSLNTGTNNNFFGASAGRYTDSGCCNNFFGASAGYCNKTGCYNNFFGKCAGFSNISGLSNNFIGDNAGACNINGSFNNFFGPSAGVGNTSGCNNNFFGVAAGSCNTTGRCNNFFGRCAGFCNISGINNNFIGALAGLGNTTGCYNNFFGSLAGFCNTTGSYNTYIGAFSACTQTGGIRNVAIGYNVQLPNTTGSTQLAIGAGNTSWINGNNLYNIGIGTTNPTSRLHMVGVGTTGPTLQLENLGTSLVADSILGTIDFISNDDSTNANGSRVRLLADVSTTAGTGRFRIQTKAGSSSTFITRVGLDGNGNLTFGTLNQNFDNLYASVYSTNIILHSGYKILGNTDTQVNVSLIPFLYSQDDATNYLKCTVVGLYNSGSSTYARVIKTWEMHVTYTTSSNTYAINGAVLGYTYNSDGTNFAAGTSVTTGKILPVISGNDIVLRLINRTSPAANSNTIYEFRVEHIGAVI